MRKQQDKQIKKKAQSYEILLKGHLSKQWSEWFEATTITRLKNGDTRLFIRIADQAALHGLLRKVRDLGMVLLSVRCLPDDDSITHS